MESRKNRVPKSLDGYEVLGMTGRQSGEEDRLRLLFRVSI